MPSTTSSSVVTLLASSTVITPSLPTFSMALAIISPISRSPLAETEPTWATSAEVLIFLVLFCSSSTTTATALSMPRFRSIGFIPAATDFAPSRTIACASTVAVVVPSPARSLVLLATSRTIWAPMFSNLSASSISLATVTPSLVIRGAPKLLSSTTLRPFGPSVTFTAFARMSTPRNILSRASEWKRTSFAGMSSSLAWVSSAHLALDHAHEIGLLHHQEFLALDPHLGTGPFAEENPIARPDVERLDLAALVARSEPDGDDLALHRLFLRGVRDDDAAGGLVLLF